MDDHRAGKIVVFLNGRLNKCGVISPRFDVALNDIEKWASNLLPSRQFGYVQVGVHEAGKRVDLIPMLLLPGNGMETGGRNISHVSNLHSL